MEILVTTADGAERTVTGQPGDTLMEALRNAGVAGVEAECGGCMTCGTCSVDIERGWFARLPDADEMEAEMLEYGLNPGPTTRLSCQITLDETMHGLSLHVPPSQR